MGVAWVIAAALLFGTGSLAQAAATARRPHAGLTGLVTHPLFLLGTLTELLGAGAHVVALQSVSMAVAQGAVTGSLAVTAIGARLVLGARLGGRGVAAVVVSALGLGVLAAFSGDGATITGSGVVEVVLAAATLVLGVGGAAATVLRPSARGPVLAVASGLAFAACSIATRLVDTSSPLTALGDPALLLLAVTGGLGCLYWTLALRHAPVTVVTAIVVVTEVVPPSLLGPLLGDEVRTGFALVAPLVLAATAICAVVLARAAGPANAHGVAGATADATTDPTTDPTTDATARRDDAVDDRALSVA